MRSNVRLLGASLVVAAGAVAACAPSPIEDSTPGTATLQQAVGEPADGYPNYGERAILYFTNRVRIDANKATDLGCPRNFAGIASKPPLDLNWNLSWSARFHSRMMQKAPCWQHDSCCYIQGTGLSAYCCDVANGAGCSAASEKYTCSGCVTGGCAGTGIWTRIGTNFGYAGSAKGENIALDQDVKSAFCAWFDEGPWANDGQEHGHFTNIMSEPNGGSGTGQSWNEMGAGAIDAPTCGGYYGGRYTQDFGFRNSTIKATLPSAIHRPQSGTSLTIGSVWNASAAPRLVSVVVDGTCMPLSLAAGSASVGAYEAAVSISAGCHGYYIQAVDGTGATVTYPTTGSLQAGSAASSCSSDYTTARTAATCCNAQVPCATGTCTSGTCVSTPGPDAGTPGLDAAGLPGLDAAAVPGLDAAGVPGLDAAGAPGLDAAAVPGLDAAAVPGLDAAAVPGLDAAAVPGLDAAAVPGLDAAAVPGLDAAAVPGLDAAAVPGLDAAAVPGLDAAAVPGLDAAAVPGSDAAVASFDGSAAAPDSGPAIGDASTADAADFGTVQSGCGCSATSSAALLWPAFFALLACLQRRRF
ncbi:MAG: hypothetical protein QM765_28185 [Myxococcales bacterium]